MMRYLHMDVKRLFKTRSFYLTILGILLCLGLFATASWLFADNMVRETGDMNIGFLPADQLIREARKLFNVARFSSFFMTTPGLARMFFILFAAGFISKDHQTGYLKNLFSIPNLREKWLTSKLVTLLLAGIIYYLVLILGSAVATLLFGNTPVINVAQLGAFFGLHLSADMALIAILCLVTAFFQTKTSAVVMGLLLATNIQTIIYFLLDQTGLIPFKLADYGMMNMVSRLNIMDFGGAQPDMLSNMMAQSPEFAAAGGMTAARLLPVTLGVFALFVVLSWVTLRKRDYRG